ncbi:MAG: SGNH/GDSL hydrolase family protein [Candidatus Rhabdochlamydia sp.]
MEKVTDNLQHPSIKQIIVFGDSLSDNGNFFSILSKSSWLFKGIHMTSPPSAHDGVVFSDNALLVEKIFEAYKLECKPAWKALGGNNYAISNATIVIKYKTQRFFQYIFPALDFNKYSLESQISRYLKDVSSKEVEEGNLFIFLAGGNDLMLTLVDKELTKEQKKEKICNLVPNSLVSYVQHLKNKHPKGYFVIIGPPDIGIIPMFYASELQCDASELSVELQASLQETISKNFPDKTVLYIPIQQELEKILSSKWGDLLPKERHMSSVSNLANGYFDRSISGILAYIKSGELRTQFINGAIQKDLDEGKRPFFDFFHSSAALNEAISVPIIKEINKFLVSLDASLVESRSTVSC